MSMKNPVHPGVLIRNNIDTLEISVSELALKLGVSRQSMSKIINQKGGVTPQMALKLAKAFNTTPEFWVNMQSQYDLAQAKKTADLDNIQVMYG